MLGTTWAHGVVKATRETYGNNFQHLLAGNIPVTVQVIHGEGPLEFLLELPPWRDGQRAEELPEVDGAVSVSVKCPEHVLRELTCVPVREEVAVDFLKFIDA